ncbi:helix-turn-helix transcriptional regulator [Pontimicrobium aquaticum]|uniref:Helix-turn-helix transcriptional regulator n=1 Tax=Pontimicrobium aquaticum TaxID=2565367 RepID=A0A4U0F049_9FLAO|nr:helix-turn-helix transcriptional regulator [Pontimicrobium aquaticum]TJY37755.1 helix-turn-helix transcriptional regulator [Pontimicrobium aquaticum]
MVNKVKVTRVIKNIGQEELAKKVGVTRQAIHSIEKGKYQPSVILAFKIAKALNIDINELFKLEEND